MSRREIAIHLRSEFRNNRPRVESKVSHVVKKVVRLKKSTHTFNQRLGNNTVFTIYLYGVTAKMAAYFCGVWFRNANGLCFAAVGTDGIVSFYNQHLFERYAERHLHNSSLSVQAASSHFFQHYTVCLSEQREKVADKVYEIETHIHGGFMLGYHDSENAISVHNTFVSVDLLSKQQLKRFASTEGIRDLLANADDEFMDLKELVIVTKNNQDQVP